MSDTRRDTDLTRAARVIEDIVEDIFATLRRGAAEAEQLWSRLADASGTVITTDLAALRPLIEARLNANSFFDGAGMVVDPSALRGVPGYQEWWRPTGDGGYEFLDVNSSFGEEPYDYTTMSWFLGASRGHDSVRGPYVDLAGSDLYVLTFAVPARYRERFIGASAADITVSAFEGLAITELSALDTEVVVVNSAGRVVMSNSPDYSAGERMRAAAPNDARLGGPGVDWRVHRV